MKNLNDIFSSFIEGFSMRGNVAHESDKYAFIKAFIITVIVALISEYVLLIPLNPRSPQFILYFSFLLLIFNGFYFIFNRGFNKIMKYSLILVGILIVLIPVGTFISSPIFNAKSYQKQLVLDKKADFYKDNKTISYESIPVVDRESAIRLGDRRMGEMVDYVSQFEVDQSYEQINYKDNPYRVTPLEYSDLIKWFTNHGDGLPAYIRVNMVSQESEVVKLKEGMKYSKSDHFGRKIERHLRANYPSLMFDTLAFEINDDGIPYWIAPVYEYKIGLFGGKDIVGAVLVNAINGDHDYYDIKKVPEWVDRVYPSNLILTQLENYGKYTNGYLNTLLSQKGVLRPTDGYNYIAINDDVYLYTGLTSVSKDASNVGFAMINLRTKDGKFYNISGAEEYSAMSSAEGEVQNLKYKATFPILINAGGQPTYFLSLKDDANLVKKYAFVSVENYQLVATGDSVAQAEQAYYALLESNGKKTNAGDFKTNKLTGIISEINEAVVDGNSTYYFKIEGNDTIFIGDISLSDYFPLAKVGDNVTVEFVNSKDNSEVISSIKFN
ncbi:CvpA family protein [Thomasclavelia spiroformis]|uniref:CvpA family protein n=2 Tax=Thomasclavelia spiroformis TaxID=29348 RepID=UPI00241E6146|nr:CvpA family protein [Thomasclavelia spiroformis]MBS6114621.1 CvpA family protein [Thomasclavelia spiroformis]MEE0441711.1 CvpA family protein [Thomasclavelia sp.]